MAETRWRTPVRRVLVQGPSMAPALRHGDQLLAWMLRRPRPGVGSVVVVELPGGRGLGVKRVQVVNPDGSLWLEGDNPFGSTDSRSFGPFPACSVRGRVLFRLWPRPWFVPALPLPREPEGPERH